MKKKLQEGYSFCKECKGTGATPDYMDCRNSSNNCCGGCDWVYKECPECDGYGQIEIDEDE